MPDAGWRIFMLTIVKEPSDRVALNHALVRPVRNARSYTHTHTHTHTLTHSHTKQTQTHTALHTRCTGHWLGLAPGLRASTEEACLKLAPQYPGVCCSGSSPSIRNSRAERFRHPDNTPSALCAVARHSEHRDSARRLGRFVLVEQAQLQQTNFHE